MLSRGVCRDSSSQLDQPSSLHRQQMRTMQQAFLLSNHESSKIMAPHDWRLQPLIEFRCEDRSGQHRGRHAHDAPVIVIIVAP